MPRRSSGRRFMSSKLLWGGNEGELPGKSLEQGQARLTRQPGPSYITHEHTHHETKVSTPLESRGGGKRVATHLDSMRPSSGFSRPPAAWAGASAAGVSGLQAHEHNERGQSRLFPRKRDGPLLAPVSRPPLLVRVPFESLLPSCDHSFAFPPSPIPRAVCGELCAPRGGAKKDGGGVAS